VQVKRLDSIFEEVIARHGAKNIFLKLDTQGYEIEILKGASRSLERTCGMQSEISVIPLYDAVPDYLTCIAYMRNAGFHITGIFSVNRDRQLRVIDFDCVMRRSTDGLEVCRFAERPFGTSDWGPRIWESNTP
jgi:hypothetical protein